MTRTQPCTDLPFIVAETGTSNVPPCSSANRFSAALDGIRTVTPPTVCLVREVRRFPDSANPSRIDGV